MTPADRFEEGSAAREALLQLLLAEEGIDLDRPAIESRDPSQAAVLSYAQERMWFLEQLETDTASLGIRTALALHGPLDVVALRRSLDEIFRRHDVLRTVIVAESGEPRPVVLALESMPLRELDVDGDEGELAAILATEAARTFDLEHDPPILVTLVRVADDHHVLSVVMHHVASDGTSFGVFYNELRALYEAFRDGLPSTLPPLPVQYQDYASWQRGVASEMFERELAYWREQLAGPLPPFEIPPDLSRPARHSFAGGRVTTRLSDDLAQRLRDLCNRTGSTTFMALLAGFEIVASRHADRSEVVIGTPIAGRVRPELEPMIGVFLNTLVLRDDLGDQPTVRTLIERVRDTCLAAFDNQDVPFELLLNELQPHRDLSRTPLFQLFFNMTHLDIGDTFSLPGLRTEILEPPQVDSKFDLTVYANDGADGTDLLLVYNRSLFDHAHMERFLEQYVHVIGQMVEHPDRHIDQISLVTEADAAVLPDTSVPLDRQWHGSVPAAVRRVAQRAADRVAVVDGSHRWSYGLFAAQMSRLATWLRLRSVGRGDIVAIYGHRTGSLVWAVTGVLASGAAYLILDPRYPPSRLASLLRIAKPSAWLALNGAGCPPAEVVEALDDLGVEHRSSLPELADVDELEALLGLTSADIDEPVDDGIGPDDPACLTFTSGSTGVPKAVVGRHGSLTHFLPWMSEEFGVGEDDRFSMLSGLSHDPLQRDMFWPLSLGATIVVPDPERMGTAGHLAEWMRDEEVTVAHLTPAMGQLVTESVGVGSSRDVTIESLRVALFIGDVLTRGQVDRLRALAPNVRVVNLYGTTETQRASGYHVVDLDGRSPEGARPKEVFPLGTGMPGAQLLVRNSTGMPAAIGEVGEVVMRSPHLALGYWQDDELTGARFQVDPHGVSPHDQLYATGDRGRYRADGTVEFLGRSDQQVQLRGFRVELGEIAATLRAHAAVADAVVQLRDDDPALPRLVAYVVPAPDRCLDTADVLRSLRSSLPAHMVPSDIVELERLPLTPNGKLDRRALPPPSRAALGEQLLGDEEPHDSLEWMLVDIWQKVLGRKHVTIHDDFFTLGGYSLLATRLFALLEERTGKRLPVSVLFEHPTIADLAAAIRDDGWRTHWSSLVPIQPVGAGQPFFYVAPYMISVLELAPLGDQLGRGRPLYGLQPQGLDGSLPPHSTIEEMAAHYIAELRSVQPDGPYALGGHCAGSWVAFEMARQLEAEGEEVSALVLVDQGPPGIEPPTIEPLTYIVNRVRFYLSGRRLRHALAWKLKIFTARVLLRRVGSPTARFEEEVRAVHRAAYRDYGGGRVKEDITLVLSADSLSLEDKAWYWRWSELTDGQVTTRDVGGTHANLLVQPFVRELAKEISNVLDTGDPPTAPD